MFFNCQLNADAVLLSWLCPKAAEGKNYVTINYMNDFGEQAYYLFKTKDTGEYYYHRTNYSNETKSYVISFTYYTSNGSAFCYYDGVDYAPERNTGSVVNPE